jgi:predicted DNA-binding transcriptional regulator AlpA
MGDKQHEMDGDGAHVKQRFLRTKEAAQLIGLSPLTLNKMRSVGGGPPFRSLGRRCVVYDRHELVDWVLTQPKRSTT